MKKKKSNRQIRDEIKKFSETLQTKLVQGQRFFPSMADQVQKHIKTLSRMIMRQNLFLQRTEDEMIANNTLNAIQDGRNLRTKLASLLKKIKQRGRGCQNGGRVALPQAIGRAGNPIAMRQREPQRMDGGMMMKIMKARKRNGRRRIIGHQ